MALGGMFLSLHPPHTHLSTFKMQKAAGTVSDSSVICGPQKATVLHTLLLRAVFLAGAAGHCKSATPSAGIVRVSQAPWNWKGAANDVDFKMQLGPEELSLPSGRSRPQNLQQIPVTQIVSIYFRRHGLAQARILSLFRIIQLLQKAIVAQVSYLLLSVQGTPPSAVFGVVGGVSQTWPNYHPPLPKQRQDS